MKQYKIGIIGTENSHARQFTRFFNIPDENGNFNYPDCHVTLVYGHYPDDSKKRVEEDGADKIAESIEEMVENVDAVMITARDGKYHYEFAKPFIEAGKPVFVDKPFTVSPAEAQKLINLAKENGVPLCGGSSLRYAKEIAELKEVREKAGDTLATGNIAAPLVYTSEYSGFYFYASHLAEMTLEVFGWNPKSVFASLQGESVSAVIKYDGFTVTNNYNDRIQEYYGSVYSKEYTAHKKVNLDVCFKGECDHFVEMVRSGEMGGTYEQLIMPVLYMNAIMESIRTGKEIEIDSMRNRE